MGDVSYHLRQQSGYGVGLAQDTHRLHALKSLDMEKALQKIGKEFEALFFQMSLKSMREASRAVQSDWFHSSAMEQFQDLQDEQMALQLAQTGRLGIGSAIERQFAKVTKEIDSEHQSGVTNGLQSSEKPQGLKGHQQDFVDALWPQFVKAGESLGVDPKIILAQSALETGWGQHTPRHNLFGMKGRAVDAATVPLKTEEYDGHGFRTEWSSFRSYENPTESVSDYVQLIKNSHRYETAMKAPLAEDYIGALQSSGYATDPKYAEKVLRIYKQLG